MDLRQHILDCLRQGQTAVSAMLCLAEVHPVALRGAWLGCRVLLDLASWHNDCFASEKPITEDDAAFMALVELRTEMLSNFTLWELEDGR